MNEYLKFSWGHIFAFLALIVVSYITFMGVTYLTNGNFEKAIFNMVFVDLLLLVWFIGAQRLKAADSRFARRIKLERFFVFTSPVVLIIAMIPMSHFWTVKGRNDAIVRTFTQSISNSKGLFADYEAYAKARIDAYDHNLGKILSLRGTSTFRNAGFDGKHDDIKRQNMVETLRLQLLSQNYTELKTLATNWIDDANQGASTWNVFLLGNTREIMSALKGWERQLSDYAANEMSNEALIAQVEPFSSSAAHGAVVGIESLTNSFIQRESPGFAAIIYAIIIYLMLIFPYVLQDRHTKSTEQLLKVEKRQAKKLRYQPHKGTIRIE
jgi:hypothetical protein